jgi:hypothetical protein
MAAAMVDGKAMKNRFQRCSPHAFRYAQIVK